jgi:hypothetical protein
MGIPRLFRQLRALSETILRIHQLEFDPELYYVLHTFLILLSKEKLYEQR